jgi:hypothetical protein
MPKDTTQGGRELVVKAVVENMFHRLMTTTA